MVPDSNRTTDAVNRILFIFHSFRHKKNEIKGEKVPGHGKRNCWKEMKDPVAGNQESAAFSAFNCAAG
jgi:hypothetical protein